MNTNRNTIYIIIILCLKYVTMSREFLCKSVVGRSNVIAIHYCCTTSKKYYFIIYTKWPQSLSFFNVYSVTNYFLVNLSIADLLVTFICMPMAVGQSVTGLWLYGETMCKLTSYLQGTIISLHLSIDIL